jgi:hypothetical protein
MKSDRAFNAGAVIVASVITLMSLFPITRFLSVVEPEAFGKAISIFKSQSILRLLFALSVVIAALWIRAKEPKRAVAVLILAPVAAFTADIFCKFLP